MTISQSVSDAQLNKLTDTTRLYLCNSEPINYAQAVSLALVQKDNPTFTSVGDYTIGREISLQAITDGVVLSNGTVTHYALVDASNTSLMATKSLRSSLAVSIGGVISLEAITFRIPNTPTGETFLEVDRPLFGDLTIGDSATGQFSTPWNYDKEWNTTRKYPLVVLIPGSGAVNSTVAQLFANIPPQFWTGTYSQSDQWKEYPCFIYCSHPDIYYDATVAEDDANTIEWIKQNYRIDESRVYALGYSMGGSGTHYLSNYYFTNFGHNVASISRLVGFLELSLNDDDVKPWYHIGLDDNSTWIQAVRDCYDNFKTAHPGGLETQYNDTVDGFPALNKVYWLNGKQMGRYSEYTNMDHVEIRASVYENPLVLNWIFGKRL